MKPTKAVTVFLLAYFFMSIFTGCQKNTPAEIETPFLRISWPSSSVGSWEYTIKPAGNSVEIRLPVFEIDGKQTPSLLSRLVEAGQPTTLRNGVTEYVYEGAFQSDTTLRLQVKFRIASDNPIVRFCHTLKSSREHKLTKESGADNLVYLSYSLAKFPETKEIRLSVFNEVIHSCNLSETKIHETDFANSGSIIGPILLGSNGKTTFLCAYEHDSMYPNNFLEFKLNPNKTARIGAVKGNYYAGQDANSFSTIWFDAGGVFGKEEEMAGQFRTFMLKYQSLNTESREPNIFYNTWGRQERVKWGGGKYLTTMNLDFTLKEIDRAHEMGIENYVLDAGWSEKAGDWGVNLKSFPDGFRQIRERLDSYGMKLGVWMDPAKAAISSKAYQQNLNSIRTRGGKPDEPSLLWETEESVNLCLVSQYWESYADKLIQLYKDLGICHFYLDGVNQTGCDDPGHFHGTAQNSREERQESYGFLLPVYLGRIIEKVCTACPDVVFDFDVTEPRRIGVGLQFLANGRYFTLNNGPYFKNFDLGESLLPNKCHNIFIQPGPARTWFMRSILDYDKWIPSNLFLAHYQPDDPGNSQIINLASLVLGQNAIWGEILKTSSEGVKLFHDVLEKYKQVREDVMAASPIHIGKPGDTPEVYEKINPATGKGVVVIFANSKGAFSYYAKNKVTADYWNNEGVTVETGDNGHAKIDAKFEGASAAIVFFGVK